MRDLIWLIIVVLVISWIFGLGFSIGGGLVHLLIVIAIIMVVLNLLFGGDGGGGPRYW